MAAQNVCTARRAPRVARFATVLAALLAVLALALAAAMLVWPHGAAMLARLHAWPGSQAQARRTMGFRALSGRAATCVSGADVYPSLSLCLLCILHATGCCFTLPCGL